MKIWCFQLYACRQRSCERIGRARGEDMLLGTLLSTPTCGAWSREDMTQGTPEPVEMGDFCMCVAVFGTMENEVRMLTRVEERCEVPGCGLAHRAISVVPPCRCWALQAAAQLIPSQLLVQRVESYLLPRAVSALSTLLGQQGKATGPSSSEQGWLSTASLCTASPSTASHSSCKHVTLGGDITARSRGGGLPCPYPRGVLPCPNSQKAPDSPG